MNESMNDSDRERLLQAGRKLLEDRRKKALLSKPQVSSSVPGVNSVFATENRATSNSVPASPIGNNQSIPASPSPMFNSPGLPTPNFTPLSSREINSPYLPTSPARDQNIQQRVDDLTLQRTQLQSQLFKQEKQNQELAQQNSSLKAKLESLEGLLLEKQQENQTIEQLQSEIQKLNQSLKLKNEELNHTNGELQRQKSLFDKATADIAALEDAKTELNAKVLENLSTFESANNENSQIQEELKSKYISLQSDYQTLSEEHKSTLQTLQNLEYENSQLTQDLNDHKQQLTILYKETEQRQKDNVDNRSFLQQKNDRIQQLEEQISSLVKEKKELTELSTKQRQSIDEMFEAIKRNELLLQQRENELHTVRQDYQQLASQSSSQSNQQDNQYTKNLVEKNVYQMEQLQNTIQRLTNERDQLNDLCIQLQSNCSEISTFYDGKLAEQANQHLASSQKLLQQINTLQSKLSSNRSAESALGQGDSSTLNEFRDELEKLEQLRTIHRQQKLPDLSVEELQELKISQLLEEIGLMQNLISSIRVIERIEHSLQMNSSRYESTISQLTIERDQAWRENQALLNGIELGDLTEYTNIKLEQKRLSEQELVDQQTIDSLSPVEKVDSQPTNGATDPSVNIDEKKNHQNSSKKRSRGWFW